jgi:hypothetical protein
MAQVCCETVMDQSATDVQVCSMRCGSSDVAVVYLGSACTRLYDATSPIIAWKDIAHSSCVYFLGTLKRRGYVRQDRNRYIAHSSDESDDGKAKQGLTF